MPKHSENLSFSSLLSLFFLRSFLGLFFVKMGPELAFGGQNWHNRSQIGDSRPSCWARAASVMPAAGLDLGQGLGCSLRFLQPLFRSIQIGYPAGHTSLRAGVGGLTCWAGVASYWGGTPNPACISFQFYLIIGGDPQTPHTPAVGCVRTC